MPSKMKKDAAASAPKPSPQVLRLVEEFLSRNGLQSTHKAFTKELAKLRQKSGWAAPEETTSAVRLEAVVEEFLKKEVEQSTTTSSDESEASSASSSTSSSDDSSSDEESEEEVSEKEPAKVKKGKASKRSVSPSSSSSSSSSSDSDADDEDEATSTTRAKAPAAQKPSASAKKPSTPVKAGMKRKAESSSSESESSSSESEEEPPTKRVKVDESDSSQSSSSEDDSSDSDNDSEDKKLPASTKTKVTKAADDVKPLNKKTQQVAAADTPSESSGTVVGDNDGSGETSHAEGLMHSERSRLINNSNSKTPPGSLKKKHVGAKPTPLAQLSEQANGEQYLSNAYQSYDYAEKAYRDLSVTRGKGFTKEKNKKKRGSYRGGPIDISGGKSFKFED
ncbi:jun-like transcription factor [Exophiala dermatitidis]|uniref:Jun-like transcription factor n=1 Tax=Exophiala dermatitidis TaxID=5970 RepID=A0AAN6F647_EXODE|nr:jun-like transcription factor [Exophiala dermatitidis]KAJ4530214.1 jun-like transcription factor [Exophiala dermatitidis]KAJ4553152.1 jun-like transcription factor [Exophiala dermatitidis]KAJ4558981.1 jun-like transcription factor [Exophiala dermatitidis]KAJ4580997.1 jun-like transcription factor [Exophiala dermatitidis]